MPPNRRSAPIRSVNNVCPPSYQVEHQIVDHPAKDYRLSDALIIQAGNKMLLVGAPPFGAKARQAGTSVDCLIARLTDH